MRTILFLLLCFIAVPAAACECAHGVLDTQAVRAAKDVFVFKVMAAAVVPSEVYPHRAVAKIEIVDRLRGTAIVHTVMYSTSWCCGIRIEVGGEYMVFATAAGPKLEVHQGNLLAMGPFGYSRDDRVRREVLAILAGKRVLDGALVEASDVRLPQVPPPPALPCPRQRARK